MFPHFCTMLTEFGGVTRVKTTFVPFSVRLEPIMVTHALTQEYQGIRN